MEAEEDHDLRSVAEIARVLKQIGDQLDNDPAYTRIVSSVASASLVGGQYTILTNLIREFVMLVARSTNVPANLVKRIIRIFLSMWNDKELSRQLLQELNLETPSDDPHSSTVDDLPQEVQRMDDDFVRQYRNALSYGKESVKSVRLMVVGMFEVGKTSLVENLVETETKQKKKVESTVGIDVRHCTVGEDGEWMEDIGDLDPSQKLVEVIAQGAFNVPEFTDDVVDAGSKENKDNEEILYDREQNIQPEQNEERSNDEISHDDDGYLPVFKEELLKIDDQHEIAFIRKVEKEIQDPTKATACLPMVSVWDFAGQYIYYSTHHFFLNSRSIYLLLMDVSRPLDSSVEETSDFAMSGFLHKDFTCLEAFKFWLNSIHMYSSQQALETGVQPTVILVGTHKDKLTGSDEEKEKQNEDYFTEALKSFIDTPVLAHVQGMKFLINNKDSKENFERIRKKVVKLAQKQKYWGESRPAKWITLERAFLRFKSEGKEIITFEDVRKAGLKNESRIESESELRAFLRFQDSIGNIIYYETESLKDLVILSPQWIIDAFRCFVTHVPDKNPLQLKLWEDYKKKAILTPELIDEIIDNNKKNKYFKDYKKEVIKYMEYLDMIARPVHAKSYGADESEFQQMEVTLPEEQRTNVNRADSETLSHWYNNTSESLVPSVFYIVPCLLQSRPQREEISCLINPQCTMKTPILCMKFRDGFMPPSVFHRLLAIYIRRYQLVSQMGQYLLYNGLAVFYVNKKSTLRIWFQDNIIYARLCFYAEDQYSQAEKIRQKIVQNLTEILKILPNESRINEISPFEEYIQCPKVTGFKPGTGLMRMWDFLYENTLMCEYHELHPVNKYEAIGSWCFDSLAAQKQQNTDIADSKLKEQPTEKDLGRIAMGIGEKYYKLGLELKLTPARLEQIREEDKFHVPTRMYHMLYACKIDRGLTFEFLRNAMIVVELGIEAFDNVFKDSYARRKQLKKDIGMDFNRKPSLKELSSLADGIGDIYWLLGVELGIKETQMQQLKDDNRYMATRVYKMLEELLKRDMNLEELGNAMLLVGADIEAFYKMLKN